MYVNLLYWLASTSKNFRRPKEGERDDRGLQQIWNGSFAWLYSNHALCQTYTDIICKVNGFACPRSVIMDQPRFDWEGIDSVSVPAAL
jgi:hypothetical protein